MRKSRVRDMVIFSMLGAIMFATKVIMELLPNIHPLGLLTVVYTVVFRKKALIPIYIYVFLNGIYGGFSLWWFPYLYLWTILWGVTMLLPRNMSAKVAVVVYAVVLFLHGALFGVLYAPAQALMFGLDFEATLAWIAAGLPFDVIHAAGNTVLSLLVLPLSRLLNKLYYKT
ncbi:MAG: hypothetical protein IJY65_03295 [Clostridia bacterium]|nr:hypothetical protein [Clostridia bacterium]